MMQRHLSGIMITRFRGYKVFSFNGFRPITVIGGKNNCGKTSLLEAVCLLANRASGMTPGKLSWNRGEKMSAQTFSSLFFGGRNEGEIIVHGIFSDNTTRGVDFECTHRSAVAFGLEDPPHGTGDVNAELPPTYVQQYYTSRGEKTVRGAMMIAFVNNEYRCYPLDPKSEKSEAVKVDGLSTDDDWRCAYYESQRRQNSTAFFSELFKAGREGTLVSALKNIDSRIESVAFDGERLLVDVGEGAAKLRLPLGVMGDGVVKAAEILALMAICPNGSVLCVDEIENGLHHTVMESFWSALVSMARERNVQIIATTHNLEMMEALTGDVVGSGEDFAFVNLTRSHSDEVETIGYTFEEYSAHLESGVEMR